MKQVFRTSLTFVGAIVGAGLCSGREIVSFFGAFAATHLFVSLAVALLLGAGTAVIVRCCQRFGLNSLGRLLSGRRTAQVFVMTCYLITVGSMLAGLDALTGWPLPLCSIGTLVIGLIVTAKRFSGIAKANSALVPLMVLAVLFVCLSADRTPALNSLSKTAEPNFWEAVKLLLYVSMNLFLALGVMTSASEQLSPRQAVLSGALTGLLLFGLLYLLGRTLFVQPPQVTDAEMPLLVLPKGPFSALLVRLLIWSAVFTTLLSALLPLTEFAGEFLPRHPSAAVGAAGFLLSRLGFSEIVAALYPVMGGVGALFFLLFLRPPRAAPSEAVPEPVPRLFGRRTKRAPPG